MSSHHSQHPENLALSQLVLNGLQYLKSLGYCKRTLNGYRQCWQRFQIFCEQRNQTVFSVDFVDQFFTSLGLPDYRIEHKLPSSLRETRAAMRVLTEFCFHGYFHRRASYLLKPALSVPFNDTLQGYLSFSTDPWRISIRSLRGRQTVITKFLFYLETRGVTSLTQLNPPLLSDFLYSQTSLVPRTLSGYATHLRAFLRYLCLKSVVPATLIEQAPKIGFRQDSRIPSAWCKDDVEKMLATVDRVSPFGKRDYAILLLAARLGLRVGDIRELRLENLHWDEGRIELTQAKTGVPQVLPLSEEIGSAIIDYLRNGRPAAACRELFVRHNAPYQPFGINDNLHYIITRYRQQAGIKLRDGHRRGMNALRHSLASRLLEAGAPLQEIANVMGHLSPETTRLYTKIDITMLRRVALDPEEVYHA